MQQRLKLQQQQQQQQALMQQAMLQQQHMYHPGVLAAAMTQVSYLSLSDFFPSRKLRICLLGITNFIHIHLRLLKKDMIYHFSHL